MRIEVRNRCSDFTSYRAARVKSLFNAESGCNFSLNADLPLEDKEWSIGVVVGPSGSGKTSIGRALWGGGAFYDGEFEARPWLGDNDRGPEANDILRAHKILTYSVALCAVIIFAAGRTL